MINVSELYIPNTSIETERVMMPKTILLFNAPMAEGHVTVKVDYEGRYFTVQSISSDTDQTYTAIGRQIDCDRIFEEHDAVFNYHFSAGISHIVRQWSYIKPLDQEQRKKISNDLLDSIQQLKISIDKLNQPFMIMQY